jgi:tripartite-type tricarboxylate transporter receptor subunit TctC
MKSRLAEQGAETSDMSPSEFSAFVKTEVAKYGKIVKESGVKMER